MPLPFPLPGTKLDEVAVGFVWEEFEVITDCKSGGFCSVRQLHSARHFRAELGTEP